MHRVPAVLLSLARSTTASSGRRPTACAAGPEGVDVTEEREPDRPSPCHYRVAAFNAAGEGPSSGLRGTMGEPPGGFVIVGSDVRGA